jgi:hypothetical protein
MPSDKRYGRRHQKNRRLWAAKVATGKVRCARPTCGELILPGEPWDLGHDDANPKITWGPEHRRCNRATLSHARGDEVSASVTRREPKVRFGGLADPTPSNEVDVWSKHWYGGFNPRCKHCRRLGRACDAADPD